jgi:hypothetical protein
MYTRLQPSGRAGLVEMECREICVSSKCNALSACLQLKKKLVIDELPSSEHVPMPSSTDNGPLSSGGGLERRDAGHA